MFFSTYGKHVVLDVWGVAFEKLNSVDFLRDRMSEAVSACSATLLSVQEHQFTPQGVTVLMMLSESHLSIHTYPESGFASLDCYTCGKSIDPVVAIDYMIKVLKPKKVYRKILKRGEGAIISICEGKSKVMPV
ncbi:MAG: S-adenosylmethionine decarboxylase proenzyme precursor [Bacillota bacterium]|jgi:S-adenosylmethionine decarboxylase